MTHHKKIAVLVHINLMVFSAFYTKCLPFSNIYIVDHAYYMPQLLWEQGRISIDWELYHEKAVKFKEYIYIVFI